MTETQVDDVQELLSALASTSHGRILVSPGTYTLTGQLNVGRAVQIAAEVPGSVVFDGRNIEVDHIIKINPGSCVDSTCVVALSGLNFTSGKAIEASSGKRWGGLRIDSGKVTVRVCHFYENTQSNGAGALVTGTTDVTFEACTFFNNHGKALYLSNSGKVIIINCQIYENTAYNDGGGLRISATGTIDVTIINSEVRGNYCRLYSAAEYATLAITALSSLLSSPFSLLS